MAVFDPIQPSSPLRYCAPMPATGGVSHHELQDPHDEPSPAGAPDEAPGHRRGAPGLDPARAPLRPLLRGGGLPGGRTSSIAVLAAATSTRRSSATCMVFFAIWWAWVNFTWFASAYDVDDLLYRLLTFVQIIGVLILAAGVESAFTSGNFTVMTIGLRRDAHRHGGAVAPGRLG